MVRVRGSHRAGAHHPRQAPADARGDPPAHGRRHPAHRGQVERGRAAAEPAHQACLRRHEPGGVSGLLPLRRPDGARASAGHEGDPHHHRRRAALGDGRRPRTQLRDRQLEGQRGRVRPVCRRGRAPLFGALRRPARGALLHDLERAQPPQLPEADLRRAAGVPQAGRHGAAPDPPQRPERREGVRGRAGAGGPRPDRDGPEGLSAPLAVPRTNGCGAPAAGVVAAASSASTRTASRTTRTAPPNACRAGAT